MDEFRAPKLAAILNASPESFYAGSIHQAKDAIARAAEGAQADGADMLDIGARSTAPYKETSISEEEELRRMVAAVRTARRATSLPISADTRSAAVARAAIDEGADAVNDVSALIHDAAMAPLLAGLSGPVILMANADYVEWNVEGGAGPIEPLAATAHLLSGILARAEAAGIARQRVILDPGIGFFRNAPGGGPPWDVAVLSGIGQLTQLGAPLLVGASRKSFLGEMPGKPTAAQRLPGSLAVAAWCALRGVAWLRVHDVRETRKVLDVIRTLAGNEPDA